MPYQLPEEPPPPKIPPPPEKPPPPLPPLQPPPLEPPPQPGPGMKTGRLRRPMGLALRAPPGHPDEPEDDDRPEDHHQPVDLRIVGVPAPLDALGKLGSVAGEHELDVLHALLDAAGVIAGAEARQHGAVDDDVGHGVGEDRLEPAADLDAHLALVRRDDEEDAVVLLLGADAPMAAELIAVILDGVALQGGQGDDDDLVGALVLERLETRRRARQYRWRSADRRRRRPGR